MGLKIKAAVVREIGKSVPYAESMPLVIEEIYLDSPKENEVLVEVAAAGLCHSDLSVINGARGRSVPMVMGHEGAGVVRKIGDGVQDIQEGDHVVFQFSVSCGRCVMCLSGKPQICEKAPEARAKGELLGGGSRLRDLSGNYLNHQAGISCFAEYAVVDRGSVVKICKSIPLEVASVFGCAVMTGVGSVVNNANTKPGHNVVVLGLGGVGLCGIMAAKLVGASKIIGIDVNTSKFAKAEQLGATHCYHFDADGLLEKIQKITDGGPDIVFDFAGVTSALEMAFQLVKRGGSIVAAGLPPAGSEVSIDGTDFVSNEKKLLGSYMGSCVPVRDIPNFLDLFKKGALPVDEIIDYRLSLSEINEGFDRLNEGRAIRQVVLPNFNK